MDLIAARFVHLAATMTLFGSAFFTAALAPASLAGDLSSVHMRRVAAPLALLSLASAVAWLVFVARDMGGGSLDLETLGAVISDTAFGAIWRVRLALLAALVVATLRPDRRWRLPAILAGAAVASLGLVGHATMQDGLLGAAHRLNCAVHLLATSGWLGGLPPFLVCLASPARRGALVAMQRFSSVGRFAVAAIFVSGGVEIALTVGALPWPLTTPYRAALAGKILVFAVMTALALANRHILAPRAGASRLAARALAAGALAEVALGLGAVALVSAFGVYDPHAR